MHGLDNMGVFRVEKGVFAKGGHVVDCVWLTAHVKREFGGREEDEGQLLEERRLRCGRGRTVERRYQLYEAVLDYMEGWD